jgi:hypothetical protein
VTTKRGGLPNRASDKRATQSDDVQSLANSLLRMHLPLRHRRPHVPTHVRPWALVPAGACGKVAVREASFGVDPSSPDKGLSERDKWSAVDMCADRLPTPMTWRWNLLRMLSRDCEAGHLRCGRDREEHKRRDRDIRVQLRAVIGIRDTGPPNRIGSAKVASRTESRPGHRGHRERCQLLRFQFDNRWETDRYDMATRDDEGGESMAEVEAGTEDGADAASEAGLVRTKRLAKWVPELGGLLWVVAAAFVAMAPALAHGASLGPDSILSQFGLSTKQGVAIAHPFTSDQVGAIIPWSTLAWQQVHHGQLPLWNQYSALGMPLAFNWQSATFSVSSLIGYLVPLRLAYTVQVLVTLVVAGTGGYFLGRVLRLGVIPSALIGTAFELSGPLFLWLGWPHATVASWGGWLFAAAVLVVRGQHRARNIFFLAIVWACAIYAGQPEILLLLGLTLGVFLTFSFIAHARLANGRRRVLRPVLDLALATGAGAALGAPLILPGLQLASVSIRNQQGNVAGPLHGFVYLLVPQFDGSVAADAADAAAYVGSITLILGVIAAAVCWRVPAVSGFTAAAGFTLLLGLFGPLDVLMNHVPIVGHVLWHRATLPMALALAVLGGFGLDALIRSRGIQFARWLSWGFGCAFLFLLAILASSRSHLPADVTLGIRAHAFIYPMAGALLGFLATRLLVLMNHRPRTRDSGLARPPRWSPPRSWVAVFLLVGETVVLIIAAIPVWVGSSSPRPLTPTSAEVSLQQTVGSSLVGFAGAGLSNRGGCLKKGGLGIPPNVNVAFGVRQLAVYDPLVPSAYFTSWASQSHTAAGFRRFFYYCPPIDTLAQADLYGVGFVLQRQGLAGPQGGQFVKRIRDEDLYSMPGAAAATLTPIPVRLAGVVLPAVDALGTPISVVHPDAASWRISTDAKTPQELRLRLTNVPGWRATIDGRLLALVPLAQIMLQARIPGGRHDIELHYWPPAFTAGLALAAASVFCLVLGMAFEGLRHRRRIHSKGSQPLGR